MTQTTYSLRETLDRLFSHSGTTHCCICNAMTVCISTSYAIEYTRDAFLLYNTLACMSYFVDIHINSANVHRHCVHTFICHLFFSKQRCDGLQYKRGMDGTGNTSHRYRRRPHSGTGNNNSRPAPQAGGDIRRQSYHCVVFCRCYSLHPRHP